MSPRRALRARIASSVAVAVVAGGLSLVAPTSAGADLPPLTLSADGSIDSNGSLRPTSGDCPGFTVPPGVGEVYVRVTGGNGNTGRTILGHGGGAGGRGAEVIVERVAVKAGQRLYYGSAPGGRPLYDESELGASPGAGGDGAWVSLYVEDDCKPDKVIAFAGGGGGGGDGDHNGPGGTGGDADVRGNDGSGLGLGRAGRGGGPGTSTAGGAGGAGGEVYDISCFCTTYGQAGTAGQSVSLPTVRSQSSAVPGRQTGGIGGRAVTGGLIVQYFTVGGAGGGGYHGGGGGGSSHGFSYLPDGSGPLAGAGSGGGGGGSSTPLEAAVPSTRVSDGQNTSADVYVEARWETTTTVTSSSNPTLPGQPVTLTATVAAVNSFGTRSLTGGTVTFDDIGTAQANGTNGTRLGEAPVVIGPDGRATATLTVPGFTGGDHRTRVRFGGYTPFDDPRAAPVVLPSTGFLAQVAVSQQTVSFTSTPGSRAAYGEPYTPSVQSTSGLPVTVTVDSSAAAVCGIDLATAPRVSFLSAGTCVLNADQPGSSAYFPAARVQQSFAVATGTPPQQQVITFTSTPPADPLRGSTYDVAAVGGGSGNPVTFTASSSFGSCSLVAPNQVRFYAGGPCRITASQAAGPGFLAAVATQDLFVKAAAQNITLRSTAPASLAVGSTYTMVVAVDSARLATFGTAPGSTGCTVVRVPPTPAGNATSSAIVTATSPGLCVVTAQETTDDIYYDPSPVVTQSIPIGIAQTVTFTSTPQDAIVGASYTPSTTGGASGQAVTIGSSTPLTCAVTNGVVRFTSSGVCVVTADQAGDSTHAAAAQANQSVTVGRASQTIAFTSTAPGDAAVGGTYTPTLQGGTSTASLSLATTSSSTCLVAGGVVTFTASGTCTVTADQAGDQNFTAAPQVTQDVMVMKEEDTTAPAVTVPPNMTLEATGPAGAVATFTASATDAVDGSTGATCTPASASTFAIGTTTVTCSKTDAAGNTGRASFTVTVKGAGTQLTDLQAKVQSLPIDPTPRKSLQSILQTAQTALGKGDVRATCDKLTSFVSQVQAMSGKKITTPAADGLLADARRIKAVLGCP